MNNNIDLTKILKDCPKGWELYSPIFGKVRFFQIDEHCEYKVSVSVINNDGHHREEFFSKEGYFLFGYDAKCLLFPSEELLDWSKFSAPWYKKERFDPKTLNVFDKVLVKIGNEYYYTWYADFVAEPSHEKNEAPLILGAKEANMVIPYNDETKHLVGTTNEAPEFYRYWED